MVSCVFGGTQLLFSSPVRVRKYRLDVSVVFSISNGGGGGGEGDSSENFVQNIFFAALHMLSMSIIIIIITYCSWVLARWK